MFFLVFFYIFCVLFLIVYYKYFDDQFNDPLTEIYGGASWRWTKIGDRVIDVTGYAGGPYVILYEDEDGTGTTVSVVDPLGLLGDIDVAELRSVADEAHGRLAKVSETLAS